MDIGLLLLRLCCALLLLHGWPKFINFSAKSGDWPEPSYLGSTASYTLTVFAVLICTVMILHGLFTRVAIIPITLLRRVHIFIMHSEDSFSDREHSKMYLMTYISLFFTGTGKNSIDRLKLKS
jgi:putative oxidoreductase